MDNWFLVGDWSSDMGESVEKSTQYKCKIINIEPDPRIPGRTIISLKINDGQKDDYIKPFSILTPQNPISLEMLMIDLEEMDLSRPQEPKDPLQYLKDALDSGQDFHITMSKKTLDSPENLLS